MLSFSCSMQQSLFGFASWLGCVVLVVGILASLFAVEAHLACTSGRNFMAVIRSWKGGGVGSHSYLATDFMQ